MWKRNIMEFIPVTSARVGDVLARSVTNPSGAVLCPQGFILTAEVIARLASAGVESVCISGGVELGPTPEERMSSLEQRFGGVTDPVLLEIKGAVEKCLAQLGTAMRGQAGDAD
jgi:hypothetical protein